MRIGEGDLRHQIALCRANVCTALVAIPRELLGDGHVRPATHPRHRPKELAQPCRISIQRRERVMSPALRFVLRFACAEGRGETAPEAIQTVIAHFQDATDVGGLGLVEEDIGLWCVAIDAVRALEKTESHERIQEVASRSRVQSQAALHGSEIARMLREVGEEFHFHGAEQCLGSPEGHAGLKDAIR